MAWARRLWHDGNLRLNDHVAQLDASFGGASGISELRDLRRRFRGVDFRSAKYSAEKRTGTSQARSDGLDGDTVGSAARATPQKPISARSAGRSSMARQPEMFSGAPITLSCVLKTVRSARNALFAGSSPVTFASTASPGLAARDSGVDPACAWLRRLLDLLAPKIGRVEVRDVVSCHAEAGRGSVHA